MGGGGLAFLNKKTWHPGRLDNQEEKWKREQAAAKEKSKLDELKKQIVLERQQEELAAVAHAAGVKDKSNRLDWMYQGGMVARVEADKRNEEQMMGARPVELSSAAAPSQADQAVKLPTFYAEDTAASANEVWSRIHSDPLFAIKQQEISARKSIASNPVKMDAIKKEVAQLKAAAEAAKAARKAEKAAKKEAKREKKAERKAEKAQAKAMPKLEAQLPAEVTNGHGEPPRKRQRSASPDRDAGRHSQHHRNGHSGRDGHAATNGHADRRAENGGSERRDAPERHHAAAGRDGGGADDANGGSKHHNKRHRDGEAGEARKHRVLIDGASAQGADLKYGLNFGGSAPDELQRHDRSELAASTQRRLEEAGRRKEAEEREKAEQRYVRMEYKTGRLTEEQRLARLAEMSGNAAVHEEARWSRQSRAREADAAEADADAAPAADDERRKGTATFLAAATREVYGASGEAASLEDRIGRRKYYAERGGGQGFRR